MGEAARRQAARDEAYATGRKWQQQECCPACGSPEVRRSDRLYGPVRAELERAFGAVEIALCLSCRAIWEPFPADGVEEDPVCSEPCDNCAFRPGSPEQQDRAAWRELIAKLDPDPETGVPRGRFYCHKGVPIDMTQGPGNFLFPTRDDGTPDERRMRTCSGFLRMVWAKNSEREKEFSE